MENQDLTRSICWPSGRLDKTRALLQFPSDFHVGTFPSKNMNARTWFILLALIVHEIDLAMNKFILNLKNLILNPAGNKCRQISFCFCAWLRFAPQSCCIYFPVNLQMKHCYIHLLFLPNYTVLKDYIVFLSVPIISRGKISSDVTQAHLERACNWVNPHMNCCKARGRPTTNQGLA